MNWGAKITVLYSGFVLMILSLVFMSMKQKVDLEEDNYYEKEIKYESRIEAMRNTSALKENLLVSVGNENIEIQFPAEIASEIKGTITLFRPSDKSLDRLFPVACNTQGNQRIPLSNLVSGSYKLKIETTASGKDYYFENSVFLP